MNSAPDRRRSLQPHSARSQFPLVPKGRPMRALIVTHYYAEHRGGVEVVARELAERLASRGLEVVWAASDEGAEQAEEAVSRLPMRAWNFTERFMGFSYPLWGPISLVRLWRAVRRCDVVHIHDSVYMGNVFAYLYARLLRKPVVVTQHVGMVPYAQRVLQGLLVCANRTLARQVLGGSDRCIFISTKVQNYFGEFVQFKTAPLYIPNGIATEIFHPVDRLERRRSACRARSAPRQAGPAFRGAIRRAEGPEGPEIARRAFPRVPVGLRGLGTARSGHLGIAECELPRGNGPSPADPVFPVG